MELIQFAEVETQAQRFISLPLSDNRVLFVVTISEWSHFFPLAFSCLAGLAGLGASFLTSALAGLAVLAGAVAAGDGFSGALFDYCSL